MIQVSGKRKTCGIVLVPLLVHQLPKQSQNDGTALLAEGTTRPGRAEM